MKNEDKAPFNLFMRKRKRTAPPVEEEKIEEIAIEPEPEKARKPKITNRKILKELSKLLNVSEEDLPRTIARFKKEAEEMEKELK